MSALPCPVADPFAAADQTYATITEFLRSEEARQVTLFLRGVPQAISLRLEIGQFRIG